MKPIMASTLLLSLLAVGCAKGKPVPWTSVASSADGTKLVAVGDGYIHTSADSGVTWTKSGPWGYWTSVASSADGTKLIAASDGDLASEDRRQYFRFNGLRHFLDADEPRTVELGVASVVGGWHQAGRVRKR